MTVISEYGKGYSYCLAMFLSYTHHTSEMKEALKGMAYGPEVWFHGAALRLEEMEIPYSYPPARRVEIIMWRDQCIKLRNAKDNGLKCDWNTVEMALDDAFTLLQEWDEFNGVKVIKALKQGT